METNLRFASKQDLRMIAQCHRKAFPSALSSAMGIAYVTKMLEWYIASGHSFLFFIESGGKCLGYCGAIVNDGSLAHGSASSMTQFSFNAAVKAIFLRPWLLVHPEFLKKYSLVVRNIYYRLTPGIEKKLVEQKAATNAIKKIGLVVIGVDPDQRGMGLGSQLLNEFDRESARRNIYDLELTVKSDNFAAIKTYYKNGWVTASDVNGATTMRKKLS